MGWVSILDPVIIGAILDVPRDWRFIGYFCLGYPQVEDASPELERVGWEQRRPVGDCILHR
jgi:5,6-dimethylbenzimidazole synthase